jgi:hypothetical protein
MNGLREGLARLGYRSVTRSGGRGLSAMADRDVVLQ